MAIRHTRIRAAIGAFAVLSAVFTVASVLIPAPTPGLQSSSEVGFVSLSPRGAAGGGIVPASCESGYAHTPGECTPCSFSPANPNVGDTVTWSVNPADMTYINQGNYVYRSYLGTNPTYTANQDYGRFKSSMTHVFTQPGTYYGELDVLTNYTQSTYTTPEQCQVTVNPAPVQQAQSVSTSLTVSSAGAPDSGANSMTVASGSTVDLHYSSSGITGSSCVVTDDLNSFSQSVTPNTSGTYTSKPLTATRTFYFYCYDKNWTSTTPVTATAIVQQAPQACSNGATNPPACTLGGGGACVNGANNPPTCTVCTPPQTLVNGTCTAPAACTNGATNPPACDNNVPTTPTISALWQGSTYIGPSGSAYDAKGYGVFAQATSPAGSALDYYFEFQTPGDTAKAEWSPWAGSGGWAGITHYANYNPGTYDVRAWAVDANGNWSVNPSAWYQVTLVPPPVSVACVGTPGNPFIGQPVTWSSTVSGGSGSYVYVWNGSDGLFGTTPSVQMTYTTAGQKNANLSITDAKSGQTASATCTTGVDQAGAPGAGGNNGTGGTGVAVSACSSSVTTNPSTVDQGGSTSVSWSVTGGSACASSCTGNGFNTGGAISGRVDNVPVSNPPTFSMSCTGGTYGPPAPSNTTVTVLTPAARIFVNGQSGVARVNQGTKDNAVVTWSSDNAVSCTGTNFSTGGATAGTDTQTATATTVYTVTCENKFGVKATASATVNIIPIFNEF